MTSIAPPGIPTATPIHATPPPGVSQRFATVIRQLREARRWSQERLAHQAQLNRSYMGEIERATAMPSLATADKLAKALGVPLSELISRCEDAPLLPSIAG